MLRKSVEERVLSSVVAEARRSATPELSGDALEAALLARAARPRSEAPSRQGSTLPRWTFALLPAAALALVPVAFWTRSPEPVAAPTATAEPTAKFDGDALAPERVIVANDKPVRIVHAGRAEWQLAARSAARVTESEGSIQVRLTRGALRASVVPSAQPERFVVEVGETRVAVRGTVFSVELLGDQSRVVVEKGSVAVGPSGDPRAARLLRAPAEGRFSLNGAPIGVRPRAATTTRAAAVRSAAPVPSSSTAVAAEPGRALAQELTIGEVEAGVSAVVKTLSDCFAQSTSGAGNVRISATTSVTLDIAPNGSLDAVQFVPPLAPAVQSCSERKLAAVRFASSEKGARVTRVLEFAR